MRTTRIEAGESRREARPVRRRGWAGGGKGGRQGTSYITIPITITITIITIITIMIMIIIIYIYIYIYIRLSQRQAFPWLGLSGNFQIKVCSNRAPAVPLVAPKCHLGAQNYTILYYTILYYTILNTMLYCTILYYNILYCTILYYAKVQTLGGRQAQKQIIVYTFGIVRVILA